MTGNAGATGNHEQRLQTLRTQIAQARDEKARAETTLQMVEKRQAEIHAELATLGVKPEELDTTIQQLDQDLQSKLAEAEALIPAEFKATAAAVR